jgi:hypothetical protein
VAEQAEAPARRAPDVAAFERTAADELHLYFAVEVEVRAVETLQDVDAAAERALGKLAGALRSAG